MSTFTDAKAEFLANIAQPEHRFADTLAFIERWFEVRPSAFQNGNVQNQADQNQGSCKVFALAQLLDLSAQQALLCFGEHYRDVLATPDADNHQNLRRVLKEGLCDISFDQFPLAFKE